MNNREERNRRERHGRALKLTEALRPYVAHIEELKSKLEAVRADMTTKREREVQLAEQLEVQTKERAARREQDRSRSVAQEKELREENAKLREALDQSLQASKLLGVRTYAESRLSNHPKAVAVRALIESSKPETREDVDAILSQFRESVRDPDDLEKTRARVRSLTRGGIGPTPLDEEAVSPDQNASRHYADLGVSLGELRRLSGMGTGLPNSKG